MSTPKTFRVAPIARGDGLRSKVVDHLVDAIFKGRLSQGDRLVVQRLADQLGISATPVREALVELEAMGFVEMLPNRGAVCRSFGRQELRELYQIRRILEVEATCEACGNLPESQLLDLQGDLHELRRMSPEVDDAAWSAQAQRLDLRFHEMIAEHSRSDRLRHEIDRYKDLMRSFRRAAGNELNVQLRAVGEHLAIIEALLALDAEQAGRRMGEHIASTAACVERVVFGDVENSADLRTAHRISTRELDG